MWVWIKGGGGGRWWRAPGGRCFCLGDDIWGREERTVELVLELDPKVDLANPMGWEWVQWVKWDQVGFGLVVKRKPAAEKETEEWGAQRGWLRRCEAGLRPPMTLLMALVGNGPPADCMYPHLLCLCGRHRIV
ncbi:hypothetical protein PLESTM_000498600 [Pleodorina starrii]|nr:hypothetical protein PLESTM_000498600 [Pleodorina starrii]